MRDGGIFNVTGRLCFYGHFVSDPAYIEFVVLPSFPLDESDRSSCARDRLLLYIHVRFDVLLGLPADCEDDEIEG